MCLLAVPPAPRETDLNTGQKQRSRLRRVNNDLTQGSVLNLLSWTIEHDIVKVSQGGRRVGRVLGKVNQEK